MALLVKKSENGSSLAGAMIAMGVTLVAIVGFTANKAKTMNVKRAQKARLSFAEIEPTLRSTLSKQLAEFAFENMDCDDVGSITENSGVPEFIFDANGVQRAGITLKRIETEEFLYANDTTLKGVGLHSSAISQCLNGSVIGRQTRDNVGEPIPFRGNSLFMCFKIDYPNAENFDPTSPIWASVKYIFTDHIVGKSLSCQQFSTQAKDPAKATRLGGILEYNLFWVGGSSRTAQTHKGSMVSTFEQSKRGPSSRTVSLGIGCVHRNNTYVNKSSFPNTLKECSVDFYLSDHFSPEELQDGQVELGFKIWGYPGLNSQLAPGLYNTPPPDGSCFYDVSDATDRMKKPDFFKWKLNTNSTRIYKDGGSVYYEGISPLEVAHPGKWLYAGYEYTSEDKHHIKLTSAGNGWGMCSFKSRDGCAACLSDIKITVTSK